MTSITDQSFTDDTVDLDGNIFIRCTFDRCVLRFNGTANFNIAESTIASDCELGVAGAAIVTVRQLRALLSYGGILEEAAKYFLFDAKAETTLRH